MGVLNEEQKEVLKELLIKSVRKNKSTYKKYRSLFEECYDFFRKHYMDDRTVGEEPLEKFKKMKNIKVPDEVFHDAGFWNYASGINPPYSKKFDEFLRESLKLLKKNSLKKAIEELKKMAVGEKGYGIGIARLSTVLFLIDRDTAFNLHGTISDLKNILKPLKIDSKKDLDKLLTFFNDIKEVIKMANKELPADERIADLFEAGYYIGYYVRKMLSGSKQSSGNNTKNIKTKSTKDKNKSILLDTYFISKNFYFQPHQISSFYTALKTKGFVILAGLSGTGKTKMAQLFGELFESKIPKTIRDEVIGIFKEYKNKNAEFKKEVEEKINDFKQNYYKKVINQTLKLEEWDNSKAGLSYELEFGKYRELGGIGGATADKFGVYYSSKSKKYKFPSNFKNLDAAFKELRKQLKSIKEYAEQGDLMKIEEKIKIFFPIVKRKLAYMFNPERILPVFSDEHLKKILAFFGKKYKNFVTAHNELMKIKEKIMRECDNITFIRFLYDKRIRKYWDKNDKIESYGKILLGVNDKEKILFLPVRPDWKDSKSLLGYYNPIMNRYESTPLFEFILKAIEDYKKNRENASPYFVILDEMNLARVEYYFADFLSVLESGRDDEGFTKEGIKITYGEDNNLKEKLRDKCEIDENSKTATLKLPPNLYFIGTVNIDETTFMFSPKVLDRAFTIEFKEVDFENYPPSSASTHQISEILIEDFTLKGKFLKDYADKESIKREIEKFKYKKELQNLSETLKPYNLHFAYRVLDEIVLFFKNAEEAKENGIVIFENDNEIIDLAVLMKVLPKFHGSRAKLEEPLWKVLNWCINPEKEPKETDKIEIWNKIKEGKEGEELRAEDIVKLLKDFEKSKFRFPHTARKVLEMLYKLYTDGYAGYL